MRFGEQARTFKASVWPIDGGTGLDVAHGGEAIEGVVDPAIEWDIGRCFVSGEQRLLAIDRGLIGLGVGGLSMRLCSADKDGEQQERDVFAHIEFPDDGDGQDDD